MKDAQDLGHRNLSVIAGLHKVLRDRLCMRTIAACAHKDKKEAMLIRFGFEIDIECAAPVPMLLALSTHSQVTGRVIGEDRVRAAEGSHMTTYVDRFGNRITRIIAPPGPTRLWSDCVIDMDAIPDPQAPDAEQHPIADLPDDVLSHLIPSRYCDSDNLTADAWKLFPNDTTGWNKVQAITRFVHQHVTFGYQFGRANKTASEVFREKTGVCRDFAHLAIALCRAMNIPARYASGYLGDIGVPYSGAGDFCAWYEVYLGGRWHTFDARYNVPRAGRILMVRGADAADVAMITSFGGYQLKFFRVWTDQIADGLDDATLHDMLGTRPDAAPLVFPSSARVA
jgi:transglutaminase-like putative cysteine protease